MTEIVYEKQGVTVALLENGKYQAKGNYRGRDWQTEEAEDVKEARQFAYFVLNQLSAEVVGDTCCLAA